MLRLLPILVSALLMAAHFLHAGSLPLVGISLAFPFLLLFRRPWAARLVQLMLALGAVEWIRTLFALVEQRQTAGQPWTRLAIILGAVAAFSAATSLVFLSRSLKERYGLSDFRSRSDQSQ